MEENKNRLIKTRENKERRLQAVSEHRDYSLKLKKELELIKREERM